MTIKDIAKETYTFTTTIVRLSKKFGYHGFEEFKKEYLKEINYFKSHFEKLDPNIPFSSKDIIQ